MTGVPSRPVRSASGAACGTGGPLSRCVATDRRTFAAQYWSHRPLLSRAAELPAPFTDLLDPAGVEELISERALRLPFFRLVRDGDSLAGYTRTVTAGSRRIADVAAPDKVRELYGGGATIVLQSLHRMWPPIVKFCRDLAAELGHPTQCNGYVTPGAGSRGFAFHHDTHDVLVLQVDGRKHWVVHEPVLALPLSSQPSSAYDEQVLVPPGATPVLDVELGPGDALYLPRGFVHAARTTDERSIHLTVGVLVTTWFDVLTDAVGLLGDEPEVRGALGLPPEAGLAEALPAFLQRAGRWLADLPPERVAELVGRRLERAVPPEPLGVLSQAEAVRTLTMDTPIRPRRGLRWTIRTGPRVVLALSDREVAMPSHVEAALRRALSGPGDARSVADADVPLEDAVVLLRRLLREGVLVAGA